MLKKFRNTLKSKKGQIGEILVVVVLIILAVLGIVKYVMPMFEKNQALAGAAGGQMDTLAKTAREAKWGVQGTDVAAQTVKNAWNEIYKAKITSSDEIQPTATCVYNNGTNHGDLAAAVPAATTYEDYANIAAHEKVDNMASYILTTITYGTDGRLTSVVYTKK